MRCAQFLTVDESDVLWKAKRARFAAASQPLASQPPASQPQGSQPAATKGAQRAATKGAKCAAKLAPKAARHQKETKPSPKGSQSKRKVSGSENPRDAKRRKKE